MDLECLRHSKQLVDILKGISVLPDDVLIGEVLRELWSDAEPMHVEDAAQVVDPGMDISKVSEKFFELAKMKLIEHPSKLLAFKKRRKRSEEIEKKFL